MLANHDIQVSHRHRSDGVNSIRCLVATLAPDYTSIMATVLTYRFLEARPKSAYRQLFIKGTRIRAEIIYRAHVNREEPRTPDQIAADYGLPLEAVRDAIEYRRSDPPEIASDIAREEAIMAASGQSTHEAKFNSQPKILSAEEWARLLS
jgi:uncharacterized protein (DUF433 family)